MYLLKQGFYSLLNRSKNDAELTGNIIINFDHEIFEGHFPNQPVMPGVCMIQLIKEQMEDWQHEKLSIKRTGQLKFLNSIIPNSHDFYSFQINLKSVVENEYTIDAKIFAEDNVFFKGNFVFTK